MEVLVQDQGATMLVSAALLSDAFRDFPLHLTAGALPARGGAQWGVQ